jgi:ribosomal protein S18 acetylase RimI-like enzyme
MEKARAGCVKSWPDNYENHVPRQDGTIATIRMTVEMKEIMSEDREAFLQMAERHFTDLNVAFVPQDDWKQHYFEKILSNPRMFARWIMRDRECAGFILYGIEDHRFLPRLTGVVYELYVRPEFRRMGIARQCAIRAIRELQAHSPSKIQLEVVNGNRAAEALWQSLGFYGATQRMVLKKLIE